MPRTSICVSSSAPARGRTSLRPGGDAVVAAGAVLHTRPAGSGEASGGGAMTRTHAAALGALCALAATLPGSAAAGTGTHGRQVMRAVIVTSGETGERQVV